jgi:hypothetical protein
VTEQEWIRYDQSCVAYAELRDLLSDYVMVERKWEFDVEFPCDDTEDAALQLANYAGIEYQGYGNAITFQYPLMPHTFSEFVYSDRESVVGRCSCSTAEVAEYGALCPVHDM